VMSSFIFCSEVLNPRGKVESGHRINPSVS
jgi:hypothetical protein